MIKEERKLLMIPGPTNVPRRVLEAMARPMISHRGEDFHKLYERIEEKAKKVFETKNDVIIFSSSGTGGVEAAIFNVVRKGDNVLIPVFGEFSRRIVEQVRLVGGNPICVEAPLGSAPTLEEIESKTRSLKEIKAFFIVYNETSPGTTLKWLKEVARIANELNSFVIVDAVSILGGDELPMDKWNIDMVITASQKCLAAPPGLALVGVSERILDYLKQDNRVPSYYFNILKYVDYLRSKKEVPFTPAIPLFYALDEALEIVLEEGLQKRIERHRITAKAFYDSFETAGLNPFVKENVRSNTVISIRYPESIEDKEFRKTLEERFGVVVAGAFGELRGKIFRIGNMGEVSKYHVMTTLNAIFTNFKLFGLKLEAEEAMGKAEKTLSGLKS